MPIKRSPITVFGVQPGGRATSPEGLKADISSSAALKNFDIFLRSQGFGFFGRKIWVDTIS